VVPAALARASCWRICSLGEGLGGVPAEHDRRADLPRPPCPPAPHDKRKGVTETDCARLLDATHQQLAGPIVMVWDNLNVHISDSMTGLVAARDWLTACRLPPYAHELNPWNQSGHI
jgi:hypothetical protein